MIEFVFNKLGYVKKSKSIDKTEIKNQLNFARSVGKRLDEHRELVEAIEKTDLFEKAFWHVGHLATQDDYLMRLYYLVHEEYPNDDGVIPNCRAHIKTQATGEYVRARPKILGECNLPEYSSKV